MEELSQITCIVQRGKADKVVDAALEAGAQGATVYYGKGTGVRQRLGILAKLIAPEKEIIIIVTKGKDLTDKVFEAVVTSGHLKEKGMGFAFVHQIDKAIGFLD